MWAARYGHLTIVTKLLSAGADARMKVMGGKSAGLTAADLARRKGHKDVEGVIRGVRLHV